MKPDVKITKRGVKIKKRAYNKILKDHGPSAIADLMKAAGEEMALRQMVAEGIPFDEACARQGLNEVADAPRVEAKQEKKKP